MDDEQAFDRGAESTRAWYERHAAEFAARTSGLDLAELYGPFLALLPAGGRILDAGCGAGRDSLNFTRLGYRVTAFDASGALVALARQRTGLPVLHLTFDQITYDADFDGVWAAASLLHVPRPAIDDVMARLARALRPGGAFHASFKYGPGERMDGERFFNDYDEPAFNLLLSRHPELELLSVALRDDDRPDRAGTRWLNALMRKRS